VTLADYYRDGERSCREHTAELSSSDLTPDDGSVYTRVDRLMAARGWRDHCVWLDAQAPEDRESLGDVAMWLAWRAGWRMQAIRLLQSPFCRS